MNEYTSRSIAVRYVEHTRKKLYVVIVFLLATLLASIYALNAGAEKINIESLILALLNKGDVKVRTILWNIRLPRVMASIFAGAGLSVAGLIMQTLLRNPLASPYTLGVSQGAAFGAAAAIIAVGTGVNYSPYLVTACAFLGAITTSFIVLFLARLRGVTPEAMVLAGVALGSLFQAATIILQYFANDVQLASIVFWTFGDMGRASLLDLKIMAAVTLIASVYFTLHRWNYNTIESGEETAKGLGVEVERVRFWGMVVVSLLAATIVSFLGIIGFVGLVGPHIMRRLLGTDHRFLIPGSSIAGAFLLLVSDTLARTVVSPVVLPVWAVTSFMGAPLFLYLLYRGFGKR